MSGLVLSLFDRTGNMVRPWVEAGYRCVCVDLRHEPGETERDGIVFVGADVLDYLPPRADYTIAFAFTPCTDVAVAGARHFKDKGLDALAAALPLFVRARRILEWTGAPYLMENPVSTISTYWRQPDFAFHPHQFALLAPEPAAEAYEKRTCLWTGGGFVMPPHASIDPVGQRKGQPNEWYSRVGGKSQATKDHRSATPLGFARAVFQANAPHLKAKVPA